MKHPRDRAADERLVLYAGLIADTFEQARTFGLECEAADRARAKEALCHLVLNDPWYLVDPEGGETNLQEQRKALEATVCGVVDDIIEAAVAATMDKVEAALNEAMRRALAEYDRLPGGISHGAGLAPVLGAGGQRGK